MSTDWAAFMGDNGQYNHTTVIPNAPAMSPGGAPGGVNSAVLQNLIRSMSQQSAAANQQNLSQYNSLLGAVDQTKNAVGANFAAANSALAGQGNVQHQLLDQQLQQQLGSTGQDLQNRGLGNTTIRSSALAGVQRNNELAQNDLTEKIAQQQAGLQTQQAGFNMQLGQMQGDALLSRQNVGPDPSLYMNLIQSLAAAPGGGAPAPHGPYQSVSQQMSSPTFRR